MEQKKADRKLKQREIEFNSILKAKDSQMKLFSDIANKSSSVTIELQTENLRLRRETKNALQQKDLLHAQTLSKTKKAS